MWIHNINPVLLQIGFLEIRYYGLVYALGFLFAYFYIRYLAVHNKIKNLNKENTDTFIIYIIIGSILGARLLDFVFFYPHIIIQDPFELFRIWNGGMSIHGGIIGAMISGYFFCRKHKVSFFRMADVSMIPLMLTLGFGRLANFINGELWGRVSNSNICVNYESSQYIVNPPNGCRHPYQIYASLKNFFVFGITYWMSLFDKLKEGTVFFSSIIFYSVGRFILDFYRDDPLILLGLTMGQILCVIFFIVSVFALLRIYKKI
ncbi:prolipoprotein diacylglyceryl transferase [Candidatus Woesearchaeota archaeon]|nr:prolipoprotein diacylglyceryl transferase [Candidatus Woesearchaeota archaeon]